MRTRSRTEEAPYLPAVIGAVCASWFAIKVVDFAMWAFG